MAGQFQTLYQLVIPAPRVRADQLRRRRVRVLTRGAAREHEVDEVWNQEQPRGVRGQARARVRAELVERVQFDELNPRALEQLCARDDLKDLFHHTARPRVAIADGLLDQRALAIDQTVIDPPTVNADAPHRAP